MSPVDCLIVAAGFAPLVLMFGVIAYGFIKRQRRCPQARRPGKGTRYA